MLALFWLGFGLSFVTVNYDLVQVLDAERIFILDTSKLVMEQDMNCQVIFSNVFSNDWQS